ACWHSAEGGRQTGARMSTPHDCNGEGFFRHLARICLQPPIASSIFDSALSPLSDSLHPREGAVCQGGLHKYAVPGRRESVCRLCTIAACSDSSPSRCSDCWAATHPGPRGRLPRSE